MTTVSNEQHPFKTAAQFERAIAPYMALPKPRHIRSGLYLGGSFRIRLLHAGVAYMEMCEHRGFRGTFGEFLRELFAGMARNFDPDEWLSEESCEIARLYRIPLPGSQQQHGERQSCSLSL